LEAFKKYEKGDGVLGVECSNHSVQTILFNELDQCSRIYKREWGLEFEAFKRADDWWESKRPEIGANPSP
jgi:hypothetical protein